jgi:hypothetical protein
MILVVTINGIFVVDTSLYTLLYTFQQIAELLILLKPDYDHKVCFIISNLIQSCPYFLILILAAVVK